MGWYTFGIFMAVACLGVAAAWVFEGMRLGLPLALLLWAGAAVMVYMSSRFVVDMVQNDRKARGK